MDTLYPVLDLLMYPGGQKVSTRYPSFGRSLWPSGSILHTPSGQQALNMGHRICSSERF
jgi:hypothetical protein